MNEILRYILVVFNIMMVIATTIGAVMMLKFSLHARTPNNAIMKYLIKYLSLSNLLVGITAMPCNIFVLLCHDRRSCDIACLARYFLTFMFSSNSLIILAVLCNYKCDLVVKVPFGKDSFVTLNNWKKLMIGSGIVSFIPDLVLALVYLYLMIAKDTQPCQPDKKHKETTHFYLGVAESIKTGALFGVCFTSIIRNVSSIRRTLASQGKRLEQSAVRARQSAKVNANLYFAVVFIIMWVPFSFVAIFASYIPPRYYQDAFTYGYTLAYLSFVLLPICYALTDGNFKSFMEEKLILRPPWNAIHPR